MSGNGVTVEPNGNRRVQLPDGREWVVTGAGVLFGAPAEVMAWTNAELGEAGPPPVTSAAMGILKRGFRVEAIESPAWLEEHLPELLVGGVYFFDSKWADIEACVVVRDVLSCEPDVIRGILSYPFKQLRKKRVTVRIPDDNERAIRTAEQLGFEIECIREGAGPSGNDVVQLYLTPEKCPFYEREVSA